MRIRRTLAVPAPLLRFGDFGESFLVPVATEIIGFDQERRGDWSVKGEEPVSLDMFDPHTHTGMSAVFGCLAP